MYFITDKITTQQFEKWGRFKITVKTIFDNDICRNKVFKTVCISS